MTEERWDGHRIVDTNTGQTVFRVHGARVCNAGNGTTEYRIRDDGRVVDVNSGRLVYRIRDNGRIVGANSGNLRYRLRD